VNRCNPRAQSADNGAGGVVVGFQIRGVIVCRLAYGPFLGAQVNPDSEISGARGHFYVPAELLSKIRV
jgi:hypothetical protein